MRRTGNAAKKRRGGFVASKPDLILFDDLEDDDNVRSALRKDGLTKVPSVTKHGGFHNGR